MFLLLLFPILYLNLLMNAANCALAAVFQPEIETSFELPVLT